MVGWVVGTLGTSAGGQQALWQLQLLPVQVAMGAMVHHLTHMGLADTGHRSLTANHTGHSSMADRHNSTVVTEHLRGKDTGSKVALVGNLVVMEVIPLKGLNLAHIHIGELSITTFRLTFETR